MVRRVVRGGEADEPHPRTALDTAPRGYTGLYADSDSGVHAGAAAMGPDATSWAADITLAIRTQGPVKTLADVIHAYPAYGEVLEAPPRELAGNANCQRGMKDTGGEALSEMDMETPEDDAAEQAREVTGENREELRELPFEVDEADAAEQVRDVGYDDDDYR